MNEIDRAFLFGMLAGVGVGAFLSVAIAEIRYKITDMRWRKQKGAEDGKEKKVSDAVNHPAHYTAGGIECIDALKAATVGLEGIEAVCTANAIKYLWRWKHKNGVEDIDKAIWYLNRLRKEITGNDKS